MKKYLKEYSYKEVIDKLQNGEVIYHDRDEDTEVPYKFFMYKGVLCFEDDNKDIHVGVSLGITELDKQCYFIEVDDSFEITETGLYKTRDGRRAFVSYVEIGGIYPVKGKIEGTSEEFSWTRKGYNIDNEIYNTDIISKWEGTK